MLEKYKLFLKWDDVVYCSNGILKLVNPVMFGPAVKICARIKNNDSIRLDITSQCFKVLDGWEIADLCWDVVVSQTTESVVFLSAHIISQKALTNKILSNSHMLCIDTQQHEDNKHYLNMVYKTTIVSKDKYPVRYDSDG